MWDGKQRGSGLPGFYLLPTIQRSDLTIVAAKQGVLSWRLSQRIMGHYLAMINCSLAVVPGDVLGVYFAATLAMTHTMIATMNISITINVNLEAQA